MMIPCVRRAAACLACFVTALGACSAAPRSDADSGRGPGRPAQPDGAVVIDTSIAGRSASAAPGTEGTGCPKPGATMSCCEKGRRMCIGGDEFATWGPCLALVGGAVLTCELDGGLDCTTNEFAVGCRDASIPDGGLDCTTNEFAPGCRDGGQSLCTDKTINNEPEILAGYTPAAGQSVGMNGQIIVWLTDEHPFPIAPHEQLDLVTGDITLPGDRTARASDGYLWEPALYIAPETAESGGKPHFPQKFKGTYNNNPMNGVKLQPMNGAPIDVPPAGVSLREKFDAEAIWDVAALGLSPGTYSAQFVVRDGDDDRGVGCVSIIIAP